MWKDGVSVNENSTGKRISWKILWIGSINQWGRWKKILNENEGKYYRKANIMRSYVRKSISKWRKRKKNKVKWERKRYDWKTNILKKLCMKKSINKCPKKKENEM